MERVIVDCREGTAQVVALSVEEEAAHLAEIETIQERIKRDKVKAAKQELLKALVELREMKQNKDVFADEDIVEKEAEVDALRAKVYLLPSAAA